MSESLFLFRLIPPRADFAQTMTADEQQAMARHMTYWQDLPTQGRVVVYGPVADPEGVWGLGVLRAAERAEALAIGELDPSVTAGVNTFDSVRFRCSWSRRARPTTPKSRGGQRNQPSSL